MSAWGTVLTEACLEMRRLLVRYADPTDKWFGRSAKEPVKRGLQYSAKAILCLAKKMDGGGIIPTCGGNERHAARAVELRKLEVSGRNPQCLTQLMSLMVTCEAPKSAIWRDELARGRAAAQVAREGLGTHAGAALNNGGAGRRPSGAIRKAPVEEFDQLGRESRVAVVIWRCTHGEGGGGRVIKCALTIGSQPPNRVPSHDPSLATPQRGQVQ